MKHHAILIGLSLGLSLGLSHVAHSQAPARVRTVSAKPCPAPAPLFVVDGVVQPDCPSPAVENAPGDDPLARFLFPPELVMAHQQEISLTDRQRSGIQEAMKDAQGRFIDAQFKMSGEVEKMQRLIRSTTVDEAKVLEQVDRVLAVERDVKRAQLGLMVRIKNQLTESQQATLNKLR